MLRIKELEHAQQTNTPVASQRIFQAYQEKGGSDAKEKRWKSVMFWPQIMLPHLFFVAIRLVAVFSEIARALQR